MFRQPLSKLGQQERLRGIERTELCSKGEGGPQRPGPGRPDELSARALLLGRAKSGGEFALRLRQEIAAASASLRHRESCRALRKRLQNPPARLRGAQIQAGTVTGSGKSERVLQAKLNLARRDRRLRQRARTADESATG